MGDILIAIVLILAVWNAVCTMGRQKKRMKNARCTGDCANCKTPCQARRIYHREE